MREQGLHNRALYNTKVFRRPETSMAVQTGKDHIEESRKQLQALARDRNQWKEYTHYDAVK